MAKCKSAVISVLLVIVLATAVQAAVCPTIHTIVASELEAYLDAPVSEVLHVHKVAAVENLMREALAKRPEVLPIIVDVISRPKYAKYFEEITLLNEGLAADVLNNEYVERFMFSDKYVEEFKEGRRQLPANLFRAYLGRLQDVAGAERPRLLSAQEESLFLDTLRVLRKQANVAAIGGTLDAQSIPQLKDTAEMLFLLLAKIERQAEHPALNALDTTPSEAYSPAMKEYAERLDRIAQIHVEFMDLVGGITGRSLNAMQDTPLEGAAVENARAAVELSELLNYLTTSLYWDNHPRLGRVLAEYFPQVQDINFEIRSELWPEALALKNRLPKAAPKVEKEEPLPALRRANVPEDLETFESFERADRFVAAEHPKESEERMRVLVTALINALGVQSTNPQLAQAVFDSLGVSREQNEQFFAALDQLDYMRQQAAYARTRMSLLRKELQRLRGLQSPSVDEQNELERFREELAYLESIGLEEQGEGLLRDARRKVEAQIELVLPSLLRQVWQIERAEAAPQTYSGLLYQPFDEAKIQGGDHLDGVRDATGVDVVVAIDFSGHGPAAAAIKAMVDVYSKTKPVVINGKTVTLYDARVLGREGLKAYADGVNDFIAELFLNQKFAGGVMMRYDPTERTIDALLGGEQIVIVGADGSLRSILPDEKKGDIRFGAQNVLAKGTGEMTKRAEYYQETLQPGERAYMLTDGFFEAERDVSAFETDIESTIGAELNAPDVVDAFTRGDKAAAGELLSRRINRFLASLEIPFSQRKVDEIVRKTLNNPEYKTLDQQAIYLSIFIQGELEQASGLVEDFLIENRALSPVDVFEQLKEYLIKNGFTINDDLTMWTSDPVGVRSQAIEQSTRLGERSSVELLRTEHDCSFCGLLIEQAQTAMRQGNLLTLEKIYKKLIENKHLADQSELQTLEVLASDYQQYKDAWRSVREYQTANLALARETPQEQDSILNQHLKEAGFSQFVFVNRKLQFTPSAIVPVSITNNWPSSADLIGANSDEVLNELIIQFNQQGEILKEPIIKSLSNGQVIRPPSFIKPGMYQTQIPLQAERVINDVLIKRYPKRAQAQAIQEALMQYAFYAVGKELVETGVIEYNPIPRPLGIATLPDGFLFFQESITENNKLAATLNSYIDGGNQLSSNSLRTLLEVYSKANEYGFSHGGEESDEVHGENILVDEEGRAHLVDFEAALRTMNIEKQFGTHEVEGKQVSLFGNGYKLLELIKTLQPKKQPFTSRMLQNMQQFLTLQSKEISAIKEQLDNIERQLAAVPADTMFLLEDVLSYAKPPSVLTPTDIQAAREYLNNLHKYSALIERLKRLSREKNAPDIQIRLNELNKHALMRTYLPSIVPIVSAPSIEQSKTLAEHSTISQLQTEKDCSFCSVLLNDLLTALRKGNEDTARKIYANLLGNEHLATEGEKSQFAVLGNVFAEYDRALQLVQAYRANEREQRTEQETNRALVDGGIIGFEWRDNNVVFSGDLSQMQALLSIAEPVACGACGELVSNLEFAILAAKQFDLRQLDDERYEYLGPINGFSVQLLSEAKRAGSISQEVYDRVQKAIDALADLETYSTDLLVATRNLEVVLSYARPRAVAVQAEVAQVTPVTQQIEVKAEVAQVTPVTQQIEVQEPQSLEEFSKQTIYANRKDIPVSQVVADTLSLAKIPSGQFAKLTDEELLALVLERAKALGLSQEEQDEFAKRFLGEQQVEYRDPETKSWGSIVGGLKNYIEWQTQDIPAFAQQVANEYPDYFKVSLLRDALYMGLADAMIGDQQGGAGSTMLLVSRDTLGGTRSVVEDYYLRQVKSDTFEGARAELLELIKIAMADKNAPIGSDNKLVQNAVDHMFVRMRNAGLFDQEKILFTDTCCRGTIPVWLAAVIDYYQTYQGDDVRSAERKIAVSNVKDVRMKMMDSDRLPASGAGFKETKTRVEGLSKPFDYLTTMGAEQIFRIRKSGSNVAGDEAVLGIRNVYGPNAELLLFYAQQLVTARNVARTLQAQELVGTELH